MTAEKEIIGQDRQKNRNQLKEMLTDALFFEDITLSSGKKSSYYVDARLVTLSSKGSLLIAQVLLDHLKDFTLDAVGGPTIGADPIISGISVLAAISQEPIDAFMVRKKSKDHGRGRRIEGLSIKGKKVAIVDDVVTSGASLLDAAQAAQDAGAQVIFTTALVDRSEGASDMLKEKGYDFKPVFKVKELL